MSRAAPDIASDAGKVEVKVTLNNERVLVGSREYLVEHVFTYGLKSADIKLDKSSVEGVLVYEDQPELNYMDNTLTLGLNENKLVYGEAQEETIYKDNSELRLFSKPLYVRLLGNEDRVTIMINNRHSYEANRVCLHVETGGGLCLFNILVNPVKILWLSTEEALVKLTVEKDLIKIWITRSKDK